MRFATRFIGTLATLFVLVTGVVQASPPPAPARITGEVGQSASGPVITVTWAYAPNMPDSTYAHDGSRLYVGIPYGGAVTFRMLAEVQDSIWLPGTATFQMPVNAQGRYFFYATGYNADGEGAPSDTIIVDYPDQQGITFSERQFVDSINTGDNYVRYFIAQGPPNASIRYSLVNNSVSGASYDSMSGEFRWTTEDPGIYTFGLMATVVEDPTNTATASLVLVVNGPDTNWTVRFTTGNRSRTLRAGQILRDSVFARARDGSQVWYALENAPGGMAIDRSMGIIGWTAVHDPASNGYYSFRVVAGKTGEAQPSAAINYTIVVSDTQNYASITGIVTDSLQQALVNATVYLYRQVAGTTSFQRFDSLAAIQGYYSFRAVGSGNYILQAVPADTIYVPGYYLRDGLATASWQNATVISIGPNAWGDSALIRLPWVNGYRGSNRLDGSVVGNGGSMKEGSGHPLNGLDPVADATVYAIDANGNVSGYDRTDAEGKYAVHGIGTGSYTLLVDKIGYRPMTKAVTFAEDNGVVETVRIELESVSGASSVRVDRAINATLELVPNPARATLRVSFEGSGGNVVVRLIDNSGRQAMMRAIATNAGMTTLGLPVGELSAGHYIITIAGPDGVAAAPVVVR